MTISLHKTLVTGSNNREMAVDLYLNSKHKLAQPLVIFCHGYKGFKDWGCWSLVAEKFAESGFNFLKFNFSHNGVTSKNPQEFTDLEAFGNNNYTKELFDVSKIIDWVCAPNDWSQFIDMENIYLIGHSRGGGIVSLATAQDERIAKAVTWASVSNLIDRVPKNVEDWKETGVIFQINGRTKQEMPLYYQFYENTTMNKEKLDLAHWAPKIKVPFSIIHGAQDEVVSQNEADLLNELIPTSQLIVLQNAGHTFGCSHPWKEADLPKDMQHVVKESIEFFNET